jgi:glycosyltransferase involved in cell wall biosynthesis
MSHESRVSLLVFETHPIQYRVPIYARVEQLCPGAIHVVYASDYSLRGGQDPGFGQSISWDSNLLSGYPSTVLRSDLIRAPCTWSDLDGRGVREVLRHLSPRVILLNSLNYQFDHIVYLFARLHGLQIWMRCETQDQAFPRSWLKSSLRSMYYRLIYSGIQRAFPIGELNRQHWLSHGLRPHQIQSAAHYCTLDRAGALTDQERLSRRQDIRKRLGLDSDQILVAFFGKLIPKKDPLLLFRCLPYLTATLKVSISLLFVGSGELQSQLEQEAHIAYECYGIQTFFPGFVNQSALVGWYLAADVVVLPSRRAGETWGLVANEALQAGCGVVVSDAVGCAPDFDGLERFRIIPVGSAEALALALQDLATYPRSFSWAAACLKDYSIEAAAQALAGALAELD